MIWSTTSLKGLSKPNPDGTDDFPSVKEPHYSFRITLEQGADVTVQRKKNLNRLVRERNKLVHHVIADWDKKSVESGRKFLQRLELQFDECARESVAMEADQKMFNRVLSDVAALARSEEFLRLLTESIPSSPGNNGHKPGQVT